MTSTVKLGMYIVILGMLSGLFYFCFDQFQRRDERIKESGRAECLQEQVDAALKYEIETVAALRSELEAVEARAEEARKREHRTSKAIGKIKDKNKVLNDEFNELSKNINCSFGADYTIMLNSYIGKAPVIE